MIYWWTIVPNLGVHDIEDDFSFSQHWQRLFYLLVFVCKYPCVYVILILSCLESTEETNGPRPQIIMKFDAPEESSENSTNGSYNIVKSFYLIFIFPFPKPRAFVSAIN